MFDAHAHRMFGVGENIRKWTKQQVREDETQSIDAKYEMSQVLTEQLCCMT